ncbi:MAG: hypothetical protein ACREGF_06035, partial [Candidatus Saccharimonadales bacterium]
MGVAKARKKKRAPPRSQYLQLPAPWYREFIGQLRSADDPIQEGLILRRLLSEQQYLKESVRLLRRFAKGYTAADGFDP